MYQEKRQQAQRAARFPWLGLDPQLAG